MDEYEKIKNYIENLRQLPEQQKKVVLFTVVAAFGIVLFFIGIWLTQRHIASLRESVSKTDFSKLGATDNDFASQGERLNIEMPSIEITNTSDTQDINITHQ